MANAGSRRRREGLGVLRSPLGIAAVAACVLVLVVAIIAPLLWSDAAAEYHPDAISLPPSAGHLVGTDSAGRDILLRVLVACRLSIVLTLAATAIAVGAGLLLGTLPYLLGSRAGRTATGLIATAVAFPSLLLAIFLATVVGVGALGAVLALGIAGAPWFARLTSTLVGSVAGKDFVLAASVLGVSRPRTLTRHILPNIAEPLAVNATIAAAANLLAFAALSFLGLGVQSPAYDWGRLLLEGLNSVYVTPWAALAPGIAIVLASLAFTLVGEASAHLAGRRGGRACSAPPPLEATSDATDVEGLLVDVRGLTVRFPAGDGWVAAVRGVDLRIRPDEAVGLVGESGSGKSLTALSVARLLEYPAAVDARRIEFDGHDLLDADEAELRRVLGGRLAVVFQDPMTSLNPVLRVGTQLAEASTEHDGLSRSQAWDRAVDRLGAVQVDDPARRAHQLPHELSGGMRQRAMIAMALMDTPRLIVADEPTTALDVTVQREVLRLLARARAETGASLLLISHDIAVVSGMCDRVLVMYAGRVVEELPSGDLRDHAQHPYTRALLGSLPSMDTPRDLPLVTIAGRPPTPDEMPAGCAFAPRCASATDRCRVDDPALEHAATPGHRIACWNPLPAPVTEGVS